MARRLLVAGVDFGTTYTKVVVRDNNSALSAEIVPGPKHDGLLPSILHINDGRVSFAEREGFKSPPLRYLKMLAAHVAEKRNLNGEGSIATAQFRELCISRPPATVAQDLLTFFFVGICNEVHAFIEGHSDWYDSSYTYEDDPDLLVMQLAVPTGLMSSIGRTEKMFREALCYAQSIAGSNELPLSKPVSYETLAKMVDKQRESLRNPAHEIQRYFRLTRIYPEVAAGAQTLLQSPNVKDGLYVTMDVGGGTIDINAFRRFSGHHQEFDVPRLDYYAAKVEPLGAERLPGNGTLNPFKTEEELMDKVRHALCALMHKAMMKQPNHGGANGGKKTWDNALIITMGGGSEYPPYTHTFTQALRMSGLRWASPVRLSSAPDVKRPRRSEFSRFGVANGISYLSENLEDFRFPHEIEDFRKIYGD